MNKPSFQEDHISQVPAGFTLWPQTSLGTGPGTVAWKNCQRLLTRCLTSNTVCLTNPSRLSLDRRTRTGALFSGRLA